MILQQTQIIKEAESTISKPPPHDLDNFHTTTDLYHHIKTILYTSESVSQLRGTVYHTRQDIYLYRNTIFNLPAVAQSGPTIVFTVSELIVYSKLLCTLLRCEISRDDSERELHTYVHRQVLTVWAAVL